MRRHDVRVLQHLPREDAWPPVIRSLFAITGPTVREGSYDYDLIHFGVILKGMDDDDAIDWIAKCESLLKRLYWYEATMHINWIFGNRTFRWKADEKRVRQLMDGMPLAGIDAWTFDDGGNPITTSTRAEIDRMLVRLPKTLPEA